MDEGKYGITVNAILPGWIATDTQPEHDRMQGLKTPLGRSGTPEEIASTVAFLASSAAGFMIGQSIVIDGGNSIVEERGKFMKEESRSVCPRKRNVSNHLF